MTDINIFEILLLRSEFEEITLNYKIPGARKPGILNNLKWFVANAHQRNRRKAGFKRAKEIATMIIDNEVNRKRTKKRNS